MATIRLILIDNNSGFICGDTAAYLAGRSEWQDDASAANQYVEPLALLACRLLDESIGEFGREYEFVGHDPRDRSSGYHVYRADAEGREAVPIVHDGEDQEIIEAVAANCPYIGFVRGETAKVRVD